MRADPGPRYFRVTIVMQCGRAPWLLNLQTWKDPGPAGATRGNVTVRLTGISKHYSGVAALSDVSAEFYAGEVHAVLGENGAGKLTLMSIISGVN